MCIEHLHSRSEAASALGELIERVQLGRESLHIPLKLPLALTEPTDIASPVSLLLSRRAPMQMKRRGVEMCIVLEGDSTPNRVDLPLPKAVCPRPQMGRRLGIRQMRFGGEARKTGRNRRSLGAVTDSARVSLATIIEAIAEGRQPVELTLEALTRRIEPALLWSPQHQARHVNMK